MQYKRVQGNYSVYHFRNSRFTLFPNQRHTIRRSPNGYLRASTAESCADMALVRDMQTLLSRRKRFPQI